jgi:tRNA isopentenyl-2-thiomethyl-A-37 hydroxylase MiaE
MTDIFEIIVEPNIRRRRGRVPLSEKKRAAALFRVWHGVREMIEEAERLGDDELVHFLEVSQFLVEERVTMLTSSVPAFALVDTSLPN